MTVETNIYENIAKGKYETQVRIPAPPRRPRKTAADYEMHLAAFEVRDDAYNSAVIKYFNDTAHLNELFKNDIMAECGLTNHPKAPMLFKSAWANATIAWQIARQHNEEINFRLLVISCLQNILPLIGGWEFPCPTGEQHSFLGLGDA